MKVISVSFYLKPLIKSVIEILKYLIEKLGMKKSARKQ
ncbi:MAG: hypothetical protein CM15mP4_1800 [Candidatus Neomarinimicrobiota bacterium]|nr:MAG: hypothetical protein CM15mP4_1800 [Candidatus Neomarinimicrobiota bacterium]